MQKQASNYEESETNVWSSLSSANPTTNSRLVKFCKQTKIIFLNRQVERHLLLFFSSKH